MEARLALLAVGIAIAVVALLGLTAPPATATSTSTTATCNQTVTHDAYRTTDAVETVNETGEAASTVDNTHTQVEDVTGFVRLHASNPNGYCVAYTVEISPEIVAAADLGEIESENDTATASWRAAQNLSSGNVYTSVTFTLEPGEEVLFAPSSARVQSLSWTGEAKRQSQGLISSIMSLFGGDSKLDQKQYTITPANGSSRITVPLEHSDGREIDSWQATYTVRGEDQPVEQDASAPVYYTETESAVTFHFSEGAVSDNASVTFTAEPSWLDRAKYSADGYLEGWETVGDLVPFSIVPVGGEGA